MLWLLLSLLRSDPARAVVGPLRVRFDFSHPLLYSMDDAARDLYQNTVLPEAADYVGRALSVERVEGPLRLARKCSSRGNNDHCYLRMDNASKLQKATYLRLWRARSWLIDFRRREIHRKYLMHVPLVNKTMDSLSGLLWRLVNSSSVGPIDTNRCGSRFQECVQNVPCEKFRGCAISRDGAMETRVAPGLVGEGQSTSARHREALQPKGAVGSAGLGSGHVTSDRRLGRLRLLRRICPSSRACVLRLDHVQTQPGLRGVGASWHVRVLRLRAAGERGIV